MISIKFQDTKSPQRNWLHFYMLKMKYLKNKKTTILTTASKIIGIKLTKEVKVLDNENCRTVPRN